MNKVVALLSIAIVIFYFSSCTKDKTATPVTCIQTDTLNTYTKSVKMVLDGECLGSGCHEGAGQAGVILDNYSGAVSAVKDNSKFFCSIEFSCAQTMPQGYSSPIDTSEINAIKRWRDNCYAQ